MITQQDPILENAIRGNYQLNVWNNCKEAWDKVTGSKAPMWGALGWWFLILFGFSLVLGTLSVLLKPFGMKNLVTIIQMIVQYVLTIGFINGFILLGVRRSLDTPIRANMVFEGFQQKCFWRSLGTIILTVLIFGIIGAIIGATMVGMARMGILRDLVMLVGSIALFYLAISYIMAVPLAVIKQLNPWCALEVSRRTITKKWFQVLWFWFLLILITLVSVLTLGILFIWTIPMSKIFFGIMYRDMFIGKQ